MATGHKLPSVGISASKVGNPPCLFSSDFFFIYLFFLFQPFQQESCNDPSRSCGRVERSRGPIKFEIRHHRLQQLSSELGEGAEPGDWQGNPSRVLH